MANNIYTHQNMQLDTYNGPPRNFRSYSVNNNNINNNMGIIVGNDLKLKKVKSTNGTATKTWGFGDAEFQRKKRVAGYKVYGFEGKLKGGFRKSFRWIKDKYNYVVYG